MNYKWLYKKSNKKIDEYSIWKINNLKDNAYSIILSLNKKFVNCKNKL